MTNIDPVRVAREACAREEERIGMPGDRFRDGRRDGSAAMQWAILGARAMQAAMAGRKVRVKATDDVLRAELEARAASLLRKAGWQAGDKLHAMAQIGNMVEFGMSVLLDPPAGCGHPNCGCDADAQCGSSLEPAGAQEGAGDQPPYPEGDVVGPCVCGSWPGGPCLKCEWRPATPAPDVPGLVERLRQEAHETKIGGPTWGDGSVMDEAADALEALQAEVATEKLRADAEAAEVNLLTHQRDAFRRDRNLAEHRATAAEAERDALKAEVRILRKAVSATTSATAAYLPPDGISANECISRIMGATDNREINAVMLEKNNGRPQN